MIQYEPTGIPYIYIGAPVSVGTSDTVITNVQFREKIRLVELSILGSANMIASGQFQVRINGKVITNPDSGGQCSLLSNSAGITINLSTCMIILKRGDVLTVSGSSSASGSQVQVSFSGEYIKE